MYKDLLQNQAFEQFPHEKLNFVVSRRHFWGALAGSIFAFSGQGEGIPAFGLDALGRLPDDQLAAIVPCVIEGCQISVDAGWVWILVPTKSVPLPVISLDSPALTAFNQINSGNTLADISADLADRMSWTSDHAFAYTRGLFLTLVLNGVCVPANNQTRG